MARKIYTRNDARPALIGMGLAAKRLLFMCLAQLERQSSKENVLIKFDASKSFFIRVKDYAELCGIDYSAAYRQIVEGVNELRGYVLKPSQGLLKNKDSDIPSDAISPFTIATDGTWYSKGDGSVNIKFAKEMEPLISSLTGNFTGQFLLSAMQLPDGNAGKLYLILREWISSGFLVDKTITVDQFKEDLGLDKVKTYVSLSRFNEMFFKRSRSILIDKTEFTDIKMEIVERRSRKAYKVKISYSYDEKAINKRDNIADKVLNKTSMKPVKKEDKNKEELRQFGIKWITKSEAESFGLIWNDGLTSQEALEKLKK